jgi:deoxycytidine triphosphate deaminase
LPTSLSDQLFGSLRDRTSAFRNHLQAIRTDNLGAPAAFHDALELVDLYTAMLEQHTEQKLKREPTEKDRIHCVKEMLSDLRVKEDDVDTRFARGGHSSIPRSLSRRIEEEIRVLGVGDDLRPVLTVGPPGNFETAIEDFRTYLFRNLYESSYDTEPRYREGEFALISVPYLEGTRAFWEPLVLGHEVGHVKVYYLNHGLVTEDKPLHYLDDLLFHLAMESGRKLRSWLQEFLCDLNTYRLYGPAAIAAVAETLAVTGERGNEASDTHPPRSTRIKLLATIASLTGDDQSRLYGATVGRWADLAEEVVEENVNSPQPINYLGTFIDGAQILWRAVCDWGSTYSSVEVDDREDALTWLTERLIAGVPGGLAVERVSNAPREFAPADVVNAAWAAEALKRNPDVPIDNLALKALDNLEFARLWQQSIERIDEPDVPIETLGVPDNWTFEGDDSEAEGLHNLGTLDLEDPSVRAIFEVLQRHQETGHQGILSGADLVHRLHPDTPAQHRLIATPVLPGAIREAGLDVRLSSSFIVFRHSATEVFDAVSGNQDPREMQESVEKEWGERFILHPDELVLAATLEYLALPGDLAGEVASRSSYGRLGLVSVTASKVQPWSTGCITLELVNTSRTPIALAVGERIAQIVFQHISNPVPMLKPTYRWPTGPEFSRVRGDWDRPIIRGVQDILKGRVPHVGPQRAFALQQSGDAILLDVRLLAEFEAGHAPGSNHIPLRSLINESWSDLPEGARVIVVSRSGGRAMRASDFLRRRGFDAYALTGGLLAWRGNHLLVVDTMGNPGPVL